MTIIPCTNSSTQKLHGFSDHLPCVTSDRLLVYQVPLLDLHTATKSAILAGIIDYNMVEVRSEASACSQKLQVTVDPLHALE